MTKKNNVGFTLGLSWYNLGSGDIIICLRNQTLIVQEEPSEKDEEKLKETLLKQHQEYIEKSQTYDKKYEDHARIQQVGVWSLYFSKRPDWSGIRKLLFSEILIFLVSITQILNFM